MGRKCGVEGCLSDSNRPEDTGVTFHKVPMHSDIRPKWISLCRIPDDKKTSKVIYICSRHFLRVDFCNFKGKKYMLRQGVLPSVFPWDKSKLEAIKSIKTEPEKSPGNDETLSSEEHDEIKQEEKHDGVKEEITVEEHSLEPEPVVEDVKSEPEETKEKPKSNKDFGINSRIEALDFNNMWYPAKIVEEDYEENEVLIHFEKYSSKYDEWICKDSPRLRPLQLGVKTVASVEQYSIGERCMACWSDARKFPATVTKALSNDTYEVLFDDGFVKNLKAHRMCKSDSQPMQSAPLFDPVKSSKQERRDKKRKHDVAALFGKKPRVEQQPEQTEIPAAIVQEEEIHEPWVPQWENGRPVGIESQIDATDGSTRKSIIVPDPRLPKGWAKHLAQRINGASAGKWDAIIVSPENRRFRSRSEVKSYLEDNRHLKYNWSMFDFSIHRHRNRKEGEGGSNPSRRRPAPQPSHSLPAPTIAPEVMDQSVEAPKEEEENTNYLKIPIVDDAYQCPIEGCGKTYRKENLAQMHVKHYHPEYTKFLNSTPNVADLAYARTVGESLDKSPTHARSTPTRPPAVKSAQSTPKVKADLAIAEAKPQSPLALTTVSRKETGKDSEIIKLLNTKPISDQVGITEQYPRSPAGIAAGAGVSDLKLRDLLNKSENSGSSGVLTSAVPPRAGIKTLLPVVRPPPAQDTPGVAELHHQSYRARIKRKRGFTEALGGSPKGNETPPHLPSSSIPLQPTSALPSLDTQQQQQQQPTTELHYTSLASQEPQPNFQQISNDLIIEGGQVIKIVRMKQEEIINCTCQYPEEDGLMIQCDLCLCWQHAFCNNIERESQVPEKYVCLICQNPPKGRPSKKYFHDQDWLKQGTLATASFHTKDEEALSKRFEKLKKSHDLSGGLLEVKDFVHTLRVKLKIAEDKNHPKLYLWSKPWDKLPLSEKMEVKKEGDDIKMDEQTDKQQSDSMLMAILKNADKEEIKGETAIVPAAPMVPQPEAAIDSADCRVNLLDHIAHSQSLIEERLDEFEKQIEALEEGFPVVEETENYPKTRQTLNLLLKDLNALHDLSQITTL